MFKKSTLFGKIIHAVKRRAYIFSVISSLSGKYSFFCPVCKYFGVFWSCGDPPRHNGFCPECGSLERHRLFVIINNKENFITSDSHILHFAPESVLVKYFSSFNPIEYITADLCNNADVVENIEKISFNDNSFNIVFCSHVLEHVDDKKAFKEIFRVLKPGGKLITMIPICEGWDITYENKDITTDNGRVLHFGQRDHVRYYGRDFVSRVESAGFTVNSFTGSPEEVIRYGLIRGEKIFVCQKAG